MAAAGAFAEVGNLTDGHLNTPEQAKDYITNHTGQFVENIAGHAAVGCASSAASGGSCGAGAAGAAFGAATSPVILSQNPNLTAGTALAATAGGVGSKLSGGTFYSGALNGAAGYLYNAAMKGPICQTAEACAASKAQAEKVQAVGLGILGGMSAVATAPIVWTVGLDGAADSVFWSGYPEAQTLAKTLGTTIEQTPIGAAMDFLTNRIGISLPQSWWDAASASFDRNAEEEATVVLKEMPRPNSTWFRVEQPILQSRGIPTNVVNIPPAP